METKAKALPVRKAPRRFGQRKRAVCLSSSTHERGFLGDILRGSGFIVSECVTADELATLIRTKPIDLVMIGASLTEVNAQAALKALGRVNFRGEVLMFGPAVSSDLSALNKLGSELGLSMLSPLGAPCSKEDLRSRISGLLYSEGSPISPINLAEALKAGWLELWYQPKIDVRTLSLCGAEALIRMHHPTWGIVPPAYFIPDDGDPRCRALSEFVVERAINDWAYFIAEHGPINIAINLPISVLSDPDFALHLCKELPKHPAFPGLIIEINGTEIIRELEAAKQIANHLRSHRIGISVDDLGAEWPCFCELQEFPFVEMKVDRKFVAECAKERLKQVICRKILQLADKFGVRTVAEGVESRADFRVVRQMGFHQVQGFLFAAPMPRLQFAQLALRNHARMVERLEP